MTERRVHIMVTGRVQGVSFRAHTATEARRLQLQGWVRNRQDGRVEIMAEGSEEMLSALVHWADSGPDQAHVEHVDTTWQMATGEFSGFAIAETC